MSVAIMSTRGMEQATLEDLAGVRHSVWFLQGLALFYFENFFCKKEGQAPFSAGTVPFSCRKLSQSL